MRTLSFSTNGITVLDGVESVQRRVEQHLSLIFGEWFANTRRGVRFLTILGRRLPPTIIAGIMAQEASTVEDVLAARVLSVTQDGQELAIELEVDSIFGTTIVTVPVAA